jgi:uncharacterized protein YceH (UPF0502 family)
MDRQGIDFILNFEECRVLGSLLEKEMTTPDYYPLTLNALVNACNQKSSRDPVVSFDESTVVGALDSLREKKLVRVVSGPDSRVAKHRQVFTDTANLTLQELSLLCVLMLRGPQTAGELRGRTERMYHFQNFEEVEATLQRLVDRESRALVAQLPRQTGLKEPRFAHLLSGEIRESEASLNTQASEAGVGSERLLKLEQQVENLRNEVAELRQQLSEFKKQFE